MPTPKHRDVQTHKRDGGQFITIPVGSNGRLAHRKVYLRTRDKAGAATSCPSDWLRAVRGYVR